MLTRRNLFRIVAAAGVLSSRGAAARALASEQQDGPIRASSPTGAIPLSRQFGRWAAALRYEHLPPEVINRAEGLTLHFVASVLLE